MIENAELSSDAIECNNALRAGIRSSIIGLAVSAR